MPSTNFVNKGACDALAQYALAKGHSVAVCQPHMVVQPYPICERIEEVDLWDEETYKLLDKRQCVFDLDDWKAKIEGKKNIDADEVNANRIWGWPLPKPPANPVPQGGESVGGEPMSQHDYEELQRKEQSAKDLKEANAELHRELRRILGV